MKRKLLCRKCRGLYGEEESHLSSPRIIQKLCKSCLDKSNESRRQHTTQKNKTEGMRKSVSDRMKKNNPMHKQETKDKVSKTLKEKYKTGEMTSSYQDPEKLKEIRSKSKLTDSGRKRLSDRMKIDNPVHKAGVREKIDKTRKIRVDSGK